MLTIDGEPSFTASDPAELFVSYVDFYRGIVLRKLTGLSDVDLTTPRVPSGWSPVTLAQHLRYMERRWFRWGFLAEQVPEPHGDTRMVDGVERWALAPSESPADVLAGLRAEQDTARRIVATHALSERGATGGRFPLPDGSVPTLGRIVAHVFQEYARHTGHLDIARELADGAVGE